MAQSKDKRSAQSGSHQGEVPRGGETLRRGAQHSSLTSDADSGVSRNFARTWRWLTILLVFLATYILVIPGIYYSPPQFRLGDRAQEDIEAPITFSVVDDERRLQEREEAASNKVFYYRYDEQALMHSAQNAIALLEKARSLQEAEGIQDSVRLAAQLAEWAEANQQVEVDSLTARMVLAKAEDVSFQNTFLEIARGLLMGVIEDPSTYRDRYGEDRVFIENLPDSISEQPEDLVAVDGLAEAVRQTLASRKDYETILEPEEFRLVLRLFDVYGQANIRFQPDVTARELNRAVDERLASVPPREFQKGYTIVEKDARFSQADIRLLDKMYSTYAHRHYMRLLAILLYIAFLFGLIGYYLHLFRSDLLKAPSRILMVALPLIFALGVGRISLEIVDAAKYPDAAAYAFPAGIIGMLIVILIDARTAVLLVTIGSLIFSVATGLDFRVFLVSLCGGYIAVTTLTGAQERKEMLKAGLLVGLSNAVMILLIHFIDDPSILRWDLTFWGIMNGLFCGIVTMPALWTFEKLFGVVTDIYLLELTGLDHPLLQELEEKVPGSFQHALNVTKLAEAAAKQIGANYLLVRAGAYYHDVGKILKPKYFSENQISIDEKALHSKLSPYMSAMVIKNHVKAGMELARKHGLPERVVDFIPQHHGTTIIAYFYMEALKRFENSQSTDPVRESDFRYPGPKPQSIETAIVMLADSTEATVTSRFTSLSVNEDALRMCVQKTITDKFSDGQFDECDLTLRDLHLIRESFVQTLLTRFHHRVAYPTKPSRSGPAAPTASRDRLERSEQ
ncbi:MAG: HD family phosphohydrolase [Candidatus Sumerlaeota bacterium]